MKYFKNKNGEVFAYETEKDRNKYGGHDLVAMDADAVTKHLNRVSTNLEVQERVWRDKELLRADIELYKVQDSDPKAVGSVAQWREYRKALRSYPESEGFPNKDKRPVAPDA